MRIIQYYNEYTQLREYLCRQSMHLHLCHLSIGHKCVAAQSNRITYHVSLVYDCRVSQLCDFGFSIHLPANKSHMSHVQRGTHFYMAPEVGSNNQFIILEM